MYASAILVTLCAAMVSMAQPLPYLEPIFPQPGLDAVDVTSSIVVRAPTGIDRRSVTFRSPDAEISGWRPPEPTVLLLRESRARTLDRSLWRRHAVVGTLVFDDDRTFRFTPRRLLPNTAYRVVVQNVVMDGQRGLMCPPLEYTFTTAQRTPHIVTSTLDSVHVVTCGQPLYVRCSERIVGTVGAAPIIAVQHLDETGTWTQIASTVSILDNGTTLCFRPTTSWIPGRPIRLDVRLSDVTGDKRDDRRIDGSVREAGRVVFSVVAVDNRPVPDAVETALRAYDHVIGKRAVFTASAPADLPGMWRFVRWESPDLPWINGSENLRIDADIPCDALQQTMRVHAVVEAVDSVRFTMEVDGDGSVDVYDADGAHLRATTQKDTFWVRTGTQQLTFVATPAANQSFAGWTSGHAGVNGSGAATITIPIKPPSGGGGSVVQVGGAHAPSVNPRFTPLDPNRTERFRLVASIADLEPDAMFDVTSGVVFTTEREFEEGQQEIRTVCVQASRCWEIIGYHDPSSGPPVWFDKGRVDLCVSAKLLDPVNNLVFFARRRRIDLRLERVLLGSEDPNNVIIGRQPHRESRIDVERRVMVNGAEQWVGLSSVTCTVGRETFDRFVLHCGDNVRFIIKNAPRRSEEWRWFTRTDRYAQPVLERTTPTGAVYTLTIDRDVAQFDGTTCTGLPSGNEEVRVQGAFRQLFGVSEIGLRVRVNARGDRGAARFEERWYDPLLYRDLDSDEPIKGRHMEYIARKGTSVKIRFTMPVDGPSVLGGAITASSYDNLLVTDPHATDLDFSTTTGPNGNTNFLPANGQSADIVEFFICDPLSRPVLQALHNGIIDVTCTRAVRSFSGEPLQQAVIFVLQRMEIPGFGLRLREADIAYDGDWDFWPFEMQGEIYHAIYGSDLAPNSALLTHQGFARYPNCGEQQGTQGECTTPYSDKGKPLSFGNKAVWLQTAWMSEADLAWWTMSTWDEDCKDEGDCLVNRLLDVIRQVKGRVESVRPDDESEGVDWAKVVPEIIDYGADIIGALMPPDEQDEHLGEATILSQHSELWGMRSAIAPQIEAYHENITYRLRGQWFVSRSVVR